ncbi:hypothetical protein K4F52_000087 [Lecanicillium sp. MT-2017a]|nr:hypothetical protein K4F52_000087 [Lecanicillium sp. MT-2017a]
MSRIMAAQRRSSFEPQCTHPTMTRVYGPDVVYGTCHRPGPLGWVFQCTQDREEMIDQSVSNGDFPTSETVSGTSLFGSGLSLMEILEQQIAHGRSLWKSNDIKSTPQAVAITPPESECNTDIVGNLKHSPRCENLDAFVNGTDTPSTPSPCSNNPDAKAKMHELDIPDEHARTLAEYGLSPCKRLSNLQPRCHSSSDFDHSPSFQQFTAAAHNTASTLSLSDSMQFKPEPLRLDHGVAMLEESVQLGVPDLITHA